MSNKTIDMFKIRQILRLYADGYGSKFISKTTGIARNTIKKYLLQFVEQRLTIERIESMSDAQMAKVFLKENPKPVNSRHADLEALLPELIVRLKKRGVTKQMVYEDYINRCPEGYKHSAFLERLNAFLGLTKPSMRVPHKAGDKLFIDFTGKKLQITDKETGEILDVEVFVAILGCSQLTYVTAVFSQKKEDFITACQRALHFYGGVPEAIVPDNLRSAVKKASRYEAELNDSFAAFAAHYNTYVFPTKVYKPKDKALVEGVPRNPKATGNIRDEATLEQLVVLSNLESINAMLLHQQLPQPERLMQLNKMAITQMRSLLQNTQIKNLNNLV